MRLVVSRGKVRGSTWISNGTMDRTVGPYKVTYTQAWRVLVIPTSRPDARVIAIFQGNPVKSPLGILEASVRDAQ
jgi:hypothetical protein